MYVMDNLYVNKYKHISMSFSVFLRATAYMVQRVYAMAILSVCLSHGWISQKRLKLDHAIFTIQ